MLNRKIKHKKTAAIVILFVIVAFLSSPPAVSGPAGMFGAIIGSLLAIVLFYKVVTFGWT